MILGWRAGSHNANFISNRRDLEHHSVTASMTSLATPVAHHLHFFLHLYPIKFKSIRCQIFLNWCFLQAWSWEKSILACPCSLYTTKALIINMGQPGDTFPCDSRQCYIKRSSTVHHFYHKQLRLKFMINHLVYKMLKSFKRVQRDIFKFLLLSNQESKMQTLHLQY